MEEEKDGIFQMGEEEDSGHVEQGMDVEGGEALVQKEDGLQHDESPFYEGYTNTPYYILENGIHLE